jgi:hypothetical protein
MEYKCEHCNFSTTKKYNYDKHLLSNKHKLVESKSVVSQKLVKVSPELVKVSPELVKVSPELVKVSPELVKVSPELVEVTLESSNTFKCKYCNQGYKHKSSLSKHIKYSCTKNKTEDLTELVRLLNLQLEQQKNQLEHKDKQLETQSKQIEKLMDKLEINNTYNTNNTINVTNNINLLNYKDTDMSHITDIDYRKCLKNLNRCVIKLIEKVHFNHDKPEMNIYKIQNNS